LIHRPELAAAFPDAGHGLPHFFIRDVLVPMCALRSLWKNLAANGPVGG
jgi:hypothetical protein